MKTTYKRLAMMIIVLFIIAALASILPASLPAAADPSTGTVVWKEICPWRAEVAILKEGRDLLVVCSTSR